MGYRYRKHNNRLVLIAQPHMILKRIKFIRKYLEYLQSDNYIFVFLDETWIYENGSQVRHWINLSDPKEKAKGSPFFMPEHLQGFYQVATYYLVPK
jgi:hypothetical protein